MGFFDKMKADKLGRSAVGVHTDANELNRRGKIADARTKYAEAMQLYTQAYDAGCRKNGILMSYAVLMMRNGMFAEARDLMKEISEIGGMNEDTHFELRVNYSVCLWRLGILDKAIETIRYAGKHCKNSLYYSSLGTFLVELAGKTGGEEDFEAARVLLDEAMDYDEDDASTLDNYGEYYLHRSRFTADADEAARLRKTSIDFYERARKARPSQVSTLYALAKFAHEDGDDAKARELADRAILHCTSRVCSVTPEQLQEFRAGLK